MQGMGEQSEPRPALESDKPAGEEIGIEISIVVGEHLKAERYRRGLTLQQLSRQTGLSVAMLSKIENGQTFPSLKTLVRLATFLGVHVASFLSGFDQQREPSLIRAGHGIEVQRAEVGGGLGYKLLAASHPASRLIQPFLITVPRARPEFPLFQHGGSEFMYILEGTMLFTHGRKAYELAPGDSFLFAGVVPHGPKEVLSVPVRFLSVTSDRLPGALTEDGSRMDALAEHGLYLPEEYSGTPRRTTGTRP